MWNIGETILSGFVSFGETILSGFVSLMALLFINLLRIGGSKIDNEITLNK